VSMVEKLADDLITGEYYLPFGPGEFRRYALENGLVDYPPDVARATTIVVAGEKPGL